MGCLICRTEQSYQWESCWNGTVMNTRYNIFLADAVKNPDPLSYLFELDKKSSTSSVLIERLNTNEKIQHMCTAKVITPANEVPGELLIGESCLYFVADDSMLETGLTEVCSQVFVMLHCMWLKSQLLLFKCTVL